MEGCNTLELTRTLSSKEQKQGVGGERLEMEGDSKVIGG